MGAYNCVCLCISCILPFAMYGHFNRSIITHNNIMKCVTEDFSSTVSLGSTQGLADVIFTSCVQDFDKFRVCCVCQIPTKLESVYETFRPLQVQVLPPRSLQLWLSCRMFFFCAVFAFFSGKVPGGCEIKRDGLQENDFCRLAFSFFVSLRVGAQELLAVVACRCNEVTSCTTALILLDPLTRCRGIMQTKYSLNCI